MTFLAGPSALIECLPDELLQLIFAGLPTVELRNAALVSRCFYRHATDFLWQDVALVDTWKLHLNDQTRHIYGDRGQGEPDEHDDTPIIEKLYILATNPTLASKVQVLTHRCHLPSPNIFSELPNMYFHADNLSQDRRLHTLLWLAIRNMVNVHTLRIIYGHFNITKILLGAFLSPNRPQRIRLRKLWLESCSLSLLETDYGGFLSPEYLTGLESIRVRRLRAESANTPERSKMRFKEFRLSRGGHARQMHNAAGGWFWSTVEYSTENVPRGWLFLSTDELRAKAAEYDAIIWNELPDVRQFVEENQFAAVSQLALPNPMMMLFEKSASTLTSLNLDWIVWRQAETNQDLPAIQDLQQLSRLRFPHLRAFQVRNAVVPESKLPDGVYLLEDMFLEFLEAHSKIQCLAWPVDKFYSHIKPSTDIQNRTRRVVAHLGNVLVDLRLDSYYSMNGETFTDESREPHEQQQRVRRRRFISEFAPYMCKVEQLKLEGGVPRDEKRELVRALHFSPLKKLVLIGVTFPVGNTWGLRGDDLKSLDPAQGSDATAHLEEEDLDGILTAYRNSAPLPPNFQFEPYYGWGAEAPFLQTLSLHHAETVEELKLCGYNGSPILSYATAITGPLLHPLCHFENLRQLVISFWLLTFFEDSYRDAEIIQSWLDTRSPTSTALVVVTPPASPAPTPPVDPAMMPQFHTTTQRPQEFNRWAVALKTRFTPSALAYRVARDIGPHLSNKAKERPGGVRVRASFCLGTRMEGKTANDIFDLDIRVGRNDQVLEFVGPREEAEQSRCWAKLRSRRWF
ncbi:hypothetical protein K458DRAFT_392157 [Lentithecium fluviatile CBS 122367]|uniref:F-box domain-containing protein n=1 Tax=Lentithecium fluviatile CBS 122367 TaxID=1168545 RepID=A0A6G1IT77_9PLEO|nr:hypothetical protein K458DRAFT_392157 [Lentithecium fluviatile CBS 122367]